MNIFEKITSCAYIPDMDFPERTDPDYESKRSVYDAEEAVGVELFKADVFAHYGCANNPKAVQAFEIAYSREKVLGLFAVLDLFEELLPLVMETH